MASVCLPSITVTNVDDGSHTKLAPDEYATTKGKKIGGRPVSDAAMRPACSDTRDDMQSITDGTRGGHHLPRTQVAVAPLRLEGPKKGRSWHTAGASMSGVTAYVPPAFDAARAATAADEALTESELIRGINSNHASVRRLIYSRARSWIESTCNPKVERGRWVNTGQATDSVVRSLSYLTDQLIILSDRWVRPDADSIVTSASDLRREYARLERTCTQFDSDARAYPDAIRVHLMTTQQDAIAWVNIANWLYAFTGACMTLEDRNLHLLARIHAQLDNHCAQLVDKPAKSVVCQIKDSARQLRKDHTDANKYLTDLTEKLKTVSNFVALRVAEVGAPNNTFDVRFLWEMVGFVELVCKELSRRYLAILNDHNFLCIWNTIIHHHHTFTPDMTKQHTDSDFALLTEKFSAILMETCTNASVFNASQRLHLVTAQHYRHTAERFDAKQHSARMRWFTRPE